jgi:hypothetical protein
MASAVSHVDMEYYWSPDSKSIIAFSALKLPTPSITPERHVLERYALPVSLWRRTVSEQVGRMSFASDGSYAAYEVVETIPSIGKVPKHICIGKIGEQEKVPLQLPDAFPAAHSFNPLWQPGRSTVAFEVRQANTNLGYLWDMKTMTITQIPAYDHLSHGITWNTRLINWSPDGTYLLLEQNMAEADVLSVGSLYAVPFGNDAKPIRFFERPGHLQTAQWSPDGKMLAIHRATNLDPMVASYRNFSIYTVADQTIAWTISDDRRLRGLVPVWMSW